MLVRKMKKIAIIRGANLNKWEMQNYEPLLDEYDVTAYSTTQHKYDISQIKLPIVQLPFQSHGLLTYMEGLEDHLADKDIVFSADISYLFSAQAVQAKLRYGCKVVCMEWENIPFNYDDHEAIGKIRESVRQNADHFIAVTERAKEALILEGVPAELIDVVNLGVDLKKFKPNETDNQECRKQMGIRKDEIVILFIGRMVWEKGVYDLVNAAAKILSDKLLRQYPVRFLMVGKGPELKGVSRQAFMLGISNRINFIEEYSYHDMHRLHNVADIFVLPSIPTLTWQEQFGMVLIESMACGKPVVATLSGSIPEVVGDAGILVQPNDHLSLYEATKKLIMDKDLREQIGRKAVERIEIFFDSNKTAEKVRTVFVKVLSSKTVKENLTDLYNEGLKHWEEGDKEKGFDLVCSAFEGDPDNKTVLDSLVEIGIELNRLDIVESSLREYLNYHPANIDSLISHAEMLYALEKPNEAEEELKKVLIFDPENKRVAAIMKELNEKLKKCIGG